MNVSGNRLAARILHIGKLLGQIIGGEEMNAGFIKAPGNNDGEKLFLVDYVFNGIIHDRIYSSVGRLWAC